jgi:hypothetical protein
MIFLLNQKPDTSLAQKSGHFYLLTTLPNSLSSDRSCAQASENVRKAEFCLGWEAGVATFGPEAISLPIGIVHFVQMSLSRREASLLFLLCLRFDTGVWPLMRDFSGSIKELHSGCAIGGHPQQNACTAFRITQS